MAQIAAEPAQEGILEADSSAVPVIKSRGIDAASKL